MKRRIVANPIGTLKPLSAAVETDVLYHGAVVRAAGPYPKSDADVERDGLEVVQSIERGVAALESQTSEYAPDAEPVPGAPVETFDLFDVFTGEHLVIWRIPCRQKQGG